MGKVDSVAKAFGAAWDSAETTGVFDGSSIDEINSLSDEEEDNRVKEAVHAEIERALAKGIPVSVYDVEGQKVYLLYPDGHRVYIEKTDVE